MIVGHIPAQGTHPVLTDTQPKNYPPTNTYNPDYNFQDDVDIMASEQDALTQSFYSPPAMTKAPFIKKKEVGGVSASIPMASDSLGNTTEYGFSDNTLYAIGIVIIVIVVFVICFRSYK